MRPIAYVMSRFPHLPETFILREMQALEALGVPIALYPLMLQEQAVVHADAKGWVPRAQTLPWMDRSLAVANLKALGQRPAASLGLWAGAAWGYRGAPGELVRALALLPKAAGMAAQMRRDNVRHIHAHYATYPALLAWAIHRLTGITYSVTVHAHDIFVSQAMLGRKLRAAAAVIAISEYNRRFVIDACGPEIAERVHIIHCGIATDSYAQATLASERLELISIGSLQEYKGFPVLIEACARLRAWGVPFRCRIIGGGEDRPQLEALIERFALGAYIELLGPKTEAEVRELLPSANCYVQPSIMTASGKMEGIPVALMEAMACGLPVIASELSGIPELVRPGETGMLVIPEDPEALARACRFIATNPAVAARQAQAGRVLVSQDFDLRTNAQRLADVFARIAPEQ